MTDSCIVFTKPILVHTQDNRGAQPYPIPERPIILRVAARLEPLELREDLRSADNKYGMGDHLKTRIELPLSAQTLPKSAELGNAV